MLAVRLIAESTTTIYTSCACGDRHGMKICLPVLANTALVLFNLLRGAMAIETWTVKEDVPVELIA